MATLYTIAATLAAFAGAASVDAAPAQWMFNVDSVILLDPSLPNSIYQGSAVQLAMKDLSRDWYKVIGVPPITSTSITVWDAGSVLTLAFDNTTLGREQFTIKATENAVGYTGVTITGGDVRGLLFGLYHFSGDFLGVDPFWWFYDLQPQYAGTITIPSNYSYDSGTPAFYSRGAFFNDEEVSGYFFADPVGDSVYEGSIANFYCEALLRLRVNTIIPSTFGYPDERHYRVAADRGLILGNHHVMPMNLNVYAYPKGVPYTYRQSPDLFHWAWQSMATYQQEQEGREMIYSVGFRGVNDEPFWNMDTQCVTDQCRGQTITQAIGNQTAIASSTPSVHQPRFVSYMWMELLGLREEGWLVIPPGTATVWTDFPGSFNILGVVNATAGDGFYAHIQMMSGTAAQITEFIPPHRMFRNMWEFWVRNATAYGMINLSDMKPVPMSGEAVYRYMWNPNDFNNTGIKALTAQDRGVKSGGRRTGPRGPVGWWPAASNPATWSSQAHMDEAFGVSASGVEVAASSSGAGTITPQQAQDTYLLEFMTRHFGSSSNASVPAAAADVWGRYMNISYMAIDDANANPNNVGDHYLGSTLRSLMEPYQSAVDSGTKPNSQLQPIINTLRAFSQANLPFVSDLFNNRVLPLQPYIPAGQPAAFYSAFVVMQVAVHYHHLVAFAAMADSATAYLAGDTASAIANATTAMNALDAMLGYMRQGEGNGLWRGSLATEAWTWCWGSRAEASHLVFHLQGQHNAAAPSNPYPDYYFMRYECENANDPTACSSFPLHNYNASIGWDAVVRIQCAPTQAGVDASGGVSAAVMPPAAAASSSRSLRLKGTTANKKALLPTHVSAGSCSTTWVGVQVTGSTSTTVELYAPINPLRYGPAGAGQAAAVTVHYTLDGTDPTFASPTYTAPFVVNINATISARAFDGSGVALAPTAVGLVVGA